MEPQQSTHPPIVDAHNDLLLELAFRAQRLREPDPFGTRWLAPLQRGRVALQVCPVFAGVDRQPEGTLREALGQVAAFHDAARAHASNVIVIRAPGDVDEVVRGGPIGLLLALEGAEPIGYDLWLVDLLYDLGVRMVGLTWNRRNQFADGAAEMRGGGLSELGRALVERCARLGILVDLAHASESTFWDVLEHAAAPTVVVSHAACRALSDHPRNLSDEQLRALAGRDGVLGVMLHPLALGRAATIETAVDHIEHAVATMGSHHVGLGGDFTQQIVRALRYVPSADALLPDGIALDAAIDGLAGPENYSALVAALRARGFVGDALGNVLSRSFLAVFRRGLAGVA